MAPVQLACEPAPVDGSHLARRVTVSPSMCGGSSLIFARLGDWTWEAVNAACRTNVYSARNAEGQPSYLSFFYFHVRGSETLHPYALTFGDELEVSSRVLDLGGQSLLTLHRLRRTGSDTGPQTLDAGPQVLDPVEFYERPRPGCMYVENVNRWISRSRQDSNQELVQAAPVGFRQNHLPPVPGAHSPRALTSRTRQAGTFYPSGPPGYRPAVPAYTMAYALDPVRDLNAVGLVYFASYFSIVDSALLGLWRQLGRGNQQFLRRRVLDHKLGYFGNADVQSTLEVRVRLWRNSADPGDEIADVAVREHGSGRLLAVAGIHLCVDQLSGEER